MSRQPSRRDFLGRATALSVTAAFWPALAAAQEEREAEGIALEVIERSQQLAGLQFSTEERELMRDSVTEHLANLNAIRELALPNDVPPAMLFRPLADEPEQISAAANRRDTNPMRTYKALRHSCWPLPPNRAPTDPGDLAFAPVTHLAHWLRTRKITATQLTRQVLERLRSVDETLHCVINYTDDRALEQAERADWEMDRNRYRGPLHGIPWGAKDLLSVAGYPTTWGAAPYRDQRFDSDAEVVRRLDEAGAILVAKTSVGALAWGDVWYGETTRNPWNPEQGSSGSSAGSASAVAAGALPFALGTETLGSIVSPSSRCGATGLRPTFGQVPRTGCMALTWSMDKIGPIARNVADASLVLEAIRGADDHDRECVSAPLVWRTTEDLGSLHFGYHASAFEREDDDDAQFDRAALDVIRGLGVSLEPLDLPELPVGDMLVVLEVEAAAAFEELTRTNRDDELVRQVEQAWPNVFRAAQLVPAVQYVQAQRARTRLMREFDHVMQGFDGYVTPSFAGGSLLVTNLTGHPTVVLPNGFRTDGTPTSLSFVGRNYGEGAICALAAAYQGATDWHRRRPFI